MGRPYYPIFDTKKNAPGLTAVKVELSEEIIPPKDFDSRKLPIALVNDPLYPALYAYCKANPPPGAKS